MSIIRGDAQGIPLSDGCVQCVVTSPPYYGLRDYGTATWEGGAADCRHVQTLSLKRDNSGGLSSGVIGTRGVQPHSSASVIQYRDLCGKCGAKRIDAQIGLEATPEAYLDTMVAVFREIKRVLRDDGTVWCNIGDNFVDKQLQGMPWRPAFALQADGWYLRSDIVWAKNNPMPESVTDRPTRSHEYIFLLTKRSSYYYDADAIRESFADDRMGNPGAYKWSYANDPKTGKGVRGSGGPSTKLQSEGWNADCGKAGRNKRDVWTIPSQATPEAHFATFPERLVEPCVLAGTSAKGCCSECGAPYVRETETIGARNEGWHDHKNDLQRGQRGKPLPADYRRETTGWRATCTHSAAIQPCLVFDPFLGSGTVGVVCERLGRRWCGLELSPEYIAIATERTRQRGLFAQSGGA